MRERSSSGQASVEMLAALPFVLLVGVAIWQVVLAGHALWMCADAARVAARADAVGEDADRAARSALPDDLEDGMRVEETDEDALEVSVRVPFLLDQWQTPIPVTARADLEPGSP